MPIIRSKTESNYFVMHNATAQDQRLSWEARGMLAYLLSKPEGWKTNLTDLTRQTGAGKDKCRRVLDELISAGYVERIEVRTSGKFARYDFHVYDTAQGAKPATIDAKTADTPEAAKPEAVKPEPANPTLIKNRDIQNTDLENTEESLCAESAPGGYPEAFENFWLPIMSAKAFHKTPLGNKREAFNEWERHAKQIPPDDLRAAWTAYLAECRRSDTSTKHVCRWIKYRGWENDYGPPMSVEDMARAARMEKWRREDEGHQDRNRELGYQDTGKRSLAGQSQT
jgi:DNA-binding MarR family transcriptional regulator